MVSFARCTRCAAEVLMLDGSCHLTRGSFGNLYGSLPK